LVIKLPKLVIFDLDGTLVEFPRDYLIQEVQRIIPIIGMEPVEYSALAEAFADFDFFRFFQEQHRESYIEAYWKEFDWSSYPKSHPFPFSTDVLAQLSELGIDSSLATARATTQDELQKDLVHTGLLEHLSELAFRDCRTLDWMDKLPQISSLLEQHNVLPEEAIMVGDIPADITSAQNAGLGGSVAVLSGGIRREVLELSQPTAIISDVSELPSLLQRLLKKQ
jgi:phosphoglycolate phosphatase-like HAD superfamily hydrolase